MHVKSEKAEVLMILPITNGFIGEMLVSVLRDTDCLTIVVRCSLVNED